MQHRLPSRQAVASPQCGPEPLSPEKRNRTFKWFDVLVLVGSAQHLLTSTTLNTNETYQVPPRVSSRARRGGHQLHSHCGQLESLLPGTSQRVR